MELSYFAKDGNFGNASGLTIIDTQEWIDSDWALLDLVEEINKPLCARVISDCIEQGRDLTDEFIEHFNRLGIKQEDLHK
jgi:hypothetical protein